MPVHFEPVTNEEFERLRTNGTKVNYYVVCPRKLWLYAHDIRLEQTSDRVALGRLLQEQAYRDEPHRELLVDNLIKIDFVEGRNTVLEVKYSQRMKEAARRQILYYLYYLKRRGGQMLQGELRFPKERRREPVALTPEAEREIETTLRAIYRLEHLPTPPAVDFMPICRSCAYLELCWG